MRCFLTLILILVSVHGYAEAPYSGGATTVFKKDHNAYSMPAKNLSLISRESFFVGNAFFTNPWVAAPATVSTRDGLGPLFNANACQSCHVKDGRGRPPAEGEAFASMLIKIGSTTVRQGDSRYGTQFHLLSIPGVEAEGLVNLEWQSYSWTSESGETFHLRKPHYQFSELKYGELEETSFFGGRTAPAMIGLGLLEAVPEDTLIALEAAQTKLGVSGRINWLYDKMNNQKVAGRFGWKASQPSVKKQAAIAFAEDMGLTSSVVPESNCQPQQLDCLLAPKGGDLEVSDQILELVSFYSSTLAVPARRNIEDPTVIAGEARFQQVGCNACHTETLMTGDQSSISELRQQEIHPYTDLLLHDLGEDLSDQNNEGNASGLEWRTAPLWGIGLLQSVNGHQQLLHDGRARGVEEAILWHGGEAKASRRAYLSLSLEQRQELLQFVESL